MKDFKAIDAMIEASRQELADLTVKLVNIKSDLEPPVPGAPFGTGVKKVLDTTLKLGKKEGFFTKDYNVGVVSLALKDSHPDLGIWVHGDVVPAGDGWEFEPYNAVEYDGRIIGRGAADNKGQLAAIFTLLKIFKSLGIRLKYNPALFIGSNEEKGMIDLLGTADNPDAQGFNSLNLHPRLSLVPDGAFPVGYGGKGNLAFSLKTKAPLHGLTLTAGQDDAPGRAFAVFSDSDTAIETFSPPVHTAHPDHNGNMITEMAKKLLSSKLLAAEDRPVIEFIKELSLDTEGKLFGINVKTETMTPLTLAAYRIDNEGNIPSLKLNVRYPIEITLEEIIEKASAVAGEYGMYVDSYTSLHKPYLLDKNNEIVQTLCKISNEVTGDDKPPYTLGGGTYAHELPNAYVFGSSSNLRPEGWPKGRGGAHGIDEAVSLDRLQRCMKIYARALLALNDIEW